uniref:Uncharacterized protein n=1 Tax=Avena sativa TaxID=4498 RepID=A0ACD5V8C9_AVESA
MLGNRMVALKMLNETLDILENKFNEEVGCSTKRKQRNVVPFWGYCSRTQEILVDLQGSLVMADAQQRLLSFDYLPNESPGRYAIGASCILEWRKCYEVIKGICEGLYYLHVKQRIIHLDLKPANILLDNNIVPNIADVGLQRCFDKKQCRAFTSKLNGTPGYMIPEFLVGETIFQVRHI